MTFLNDDIGNKELREFMQINSLDDIWRERNPNVIRYTFHRKESKSRLDYFLTSNVLNQQISNASISHCSFSDHELVSIKLDLVDTKRGPGYWKMNAKIIESERYKVTFQSFWKSWIREKNKYKNKREWWEATKWKIENLTIQISNSMNVKEREIQRLEKELERLD